MDQKERKKISGGAYKYAFSDDVIMWELVNKMAGEKLVNPISLTNLQQCKSRFVSPSLDQREADVVYEVLGTNGKPYLYILIEHQSSVDKIIPFRAGRHLWCLLAHASGNVPIYWANIS